MGVGLVQLCLVGFPVRSIAAWAAQGFNEPLVATYDSKQSSVDEVLAGGNGEAYLLYYLPQNGPQQPALVVRLAKADGASDSVAEVFDAPPGYAYVPVEIIDGYPVLPGNLIPTITMTALGGWWIRGSITNYNLDIRVNGPVVTMWSSQGDTGWARWVADGEPNAQISIRDTDGDGEADWDWRTMLPEYPGRGDYRTTYAERKCSTPLRFDKGIYPAWPMIAGDTDLQFEQLSGVSRPPIVVDWQTGRILHFSEVVTLRNQNCSYGMHSITRILPSQMNSPDFEAPFAFYDLSERGSGYPNLILRTGRTIVKEDAAGGVSEQMEVIRYS